MLFGQRGRGKDASCDDQPAVKLAHPLRFTHSSKSFGSSTAESSSQLAPVEATGSESTRDGVSSASSCGSRVRFADEFGDGSLAEVHFIGNEFATGSGSKEHKARKLAESLGNAVEHVMCFLERKL
mmetsp:Transcript_43508/g.100119  ORF Transcript_43508/g.100119 Transcript_43508/m.100119 type:complete len:126 (-) Transcript_43508:76-453(-)